MNEISSTTLDEAEKFYREVFGYEPVKDVVKRYDMMDPDEARWFALGLMAAYQNAGGDALAPRVRLAVTNIFMNAIPGEWFR